MDTSRYTEYSLDDLRDVERRIDREKFPERYAALRAEIERREADAPLPWEPKPAWHKKVRQAHMRIFLSVWFGCLASAAVDGWVAEHAKLRPTATHTQARQIRIAKSRMVTVYTTRGQQTLTWYLSLFWMPGIPLIVVSGFIVDRWVGLNPRRG
jgi:hypothetical protein